MIIIYLFLGVVFIGCGFLVKAFPGSIAGYNTMSAKRKEKVDVVGLSTMMKQYLIAIGVSVCILPLSLKIMDWHLAADITMGVVIFVGILFMLYQTPKFDHNEYSIFRKRFPFILISVIFSGIVIALAHGTSAPDVSISDHQITISGQYGLTQKVGQMELMESIPSVETKYNGLAFGDICKGDFKVGDWGRCRLFLQSRQGPFIVIKTEGDPIIINSRTPEGTNALFDQITDQ